MKMFLFKGVCAESICIMTGKEETVIDSYQPGSSADRIAVR